MAVNMVTGDSISEVETPLIDDVVRGFVDFNGHPATRSKSGYWKSASFIIGVEVAARFSYIGIGSNLISYLTGPLGQPTATAAANVNAWTGAAALLPLLGGFVADSYLGRYRTICIASSVYMLGLGLLSVSAALHSFNYQLCKNESNNSACSPLKLEVVVFFFSLYLVAFAEGGVRPCLQAFGADQFDEEDKNESNAKSSFFNWWFFAMCGGSLLAYSVLNYIQENMSWALAFGIPCIAIFFALIIFLLGSTTYRFHIKREERNPLVQKSRALASDEEDIKFCSRCCIGDGKAILGLVPIWCTCLGYAVVVSQVSTLFTKQGSTMDRYITNTFQIPAASLQSLASLSVIVFIPIYDRILVRIARAMTKKYAGISMLQRIGIGLLLSFLSMIIAALVERRRLMIASDYGLVDEPKTTLPMSVWWLAPQYLLFGIADVFVIVGLQEFFYSEAPGGLKSIGLALYLSIIGIGNFLSSFLIFVIEKTTSREGRDSWFSNNLNRAHIDYFYWILAGVGAVTMGAYAYFAHYYVYKRKDIVS